MSDAGKRHRELQEKDLKYIWHPCSQMKDYEALPPIVVDRAKGLWLWDVDGKGYLDIVSSWWCSLLGHGHPRVNQALKDQLDRLEHVIFANFSHEPAIALAERLSRLVPPGLARFHFSDNGSASVECALKMSFQYQLQTGHPEKKRFMALAGGYHGETLGALSVGGMDLYTRIYKPLMTDAIRVEAPDCFRCRFGLSRDSCEAECFEAAERAFQQHGAETAAFIAEPVLQGAGGMKIYSPLYLKKLRRACDRCGALLIADEIATGFFRTGRLFACEHAGISPDLMCISKGLTGGYLPMSITAVTRKVYDAFYADWSEGRAFMHSHTYSGNPLAASAALAVLDVLEEGTVTAGARENAPFLTSCLEEAFAGHPNLGEIRHIGLIHALELVEDRETKRPFDPASRTGYQIYLRALERGLLLRPIGDVIYFNPPLTISREEIEKAVLLTRESVRDVLG